MGPNLQSGRQAGVAPQELGNIFSVFICSVFILQSGKEDLERILDPEIIVSFVRIQSGPGKGTPGLPVEYILIRVSEVGKPTYCGWSHSLDSDPGLCVGVGMPFQSYQLAFVVQMRNRRKEIPTPAVSSALKVLFDKEDIFSTPPPLPLPTSSPHP